MSLPDVVDLPSMKKKFKIHITVYDAETDRTFAKTIFFGEDGDYVFTHDRMNRLKKLHSLKNMNNVLHGDYWRAQICFSGENWIENSLKVIKHFL